MQTTSYNDIQDEIHVFDANKNGLFLDMSDGGEIMTLQDGDKNEYILDRSDNGTLDAILYPDDSYEAFYSLSDGTIIMQQRNGQVSKYKFDEEERLTFSQINENDDTFYSFDRQGNLRGYYSNSESIELAYNSANMLQTIYYLQQCRIDKTYQNNRLTSTEIIKHHYNVRYEYDSVGKLIKVHNDNTLLAEIAYNEDGTIASKKFGNGARTKFTYYPNVKSVKTIDHFSRNGSLFESLRYKYESEWRQISVETLSGEWKFSYDPAGQLTYYKDPSGSVSRISYDAGGNRLILNSAGQRVPYATNVLSQYVQIGDAKDVTYDKNGNMISGPNQTFEYDNENKLKSFTSLTDQCALSYDVMGNLRQKRCSQYGVTYFRDMRSDGNIVMEVFFIIITMWCFVQVILHCW